MNLLEALVVLLEETRERDDVPSVRRARRRVQKKADSLRAYRSRNLQRKAGVGTDATALSTSDVELEVQL